MNKLYLLAASALICGSAYADTFDKGDMVVDLGIGVGSADNIETNGRFPDYSYSKSSGATFTQKLGFEYGVAKINDSSIGIGLLINNAYGASYDAVASGVYDYTYTLSRYHYVSGNRGRGRWECYQTTRERREGAGLAKARYAIDNIDFMLKGSFHHQFIDNLDTYATFGLGVSVYKLICSPEKDVTNGFSSGSSSVDFSQSGGGPQFSYSYDDIDHAEWAGTRAKARFAMALFVGARYYLTPNWAVNAEFGLTSASFKKNANTYNILSVGASYKF